MLSWSASSSSSITIRRHAAAALISKPQIPNLRRHTDRIARLDGPLVQPALVRGMIVKILGASCRVVEFELGHEAAVGLGVGTSLADEGEGGGGGEFGVGVVVVGGG